MAQINNQWAWLIGVIIAWFDSFARVFVMVQYGEHDCRDIAKQQGDYQIIFVLDIQQACWMCHGTRLDNDGTKDFFQLQNTIESLHHGHGCHEYEGSAVTSLSISIFEFSKSLLTQ